MSTDFPIPADVPLTKPYWSALERGDLTFQRCDHCRHAWLPPRSECPNCLSPEFSWAKASGRAKLISWVVYYRSMHPAFADRIPYTVAIVELLEGPRMITNVVDAGDPEALVLNQPLQLKIEAEPGVSVARFTPIKA
ncbi:Zn-ribbon domain-containing OB-fold protein [Sphingobium ummariense]